MTKTEIIIACVVASLFVVLVFGTWLSAYYESRTFNRFTGAHTTAWDALWVELRVQEPTRKDK